MSYTTEVLGWLMIFQAPGTIISKPLCRQEHSLFEGLNQYQLNGGKLRKDAFKMASMSRGRSHYKLKNLETCEAIIVKML